MTPDDITYHFNSRFARFVRWLCRKKKTSNWCVTIGRHVFISKGYILSPTRAHEYKHTLQWKEEGWLKFPIKYLWGSRKGYKLNPYEIEADDYMLEHSRKFPALTRKK